jgi:hypothetical protein
MVVVTRSSSRRGRTNGVLTLGNQQMIVQDSPQSCRSKSNSVSAPSSGAHLSTEPIRNLTQPSKDMAEARSKLTVAVSRTLQELIEQDGYSRERATALLIRRIRREDDPPKDDDVSNNFYL